MVGDILQDDHRSGKISHLKKKWRKARLMPLFREDMASRGKMVSAVDPGLERVLVENRVTFRVTLQ